MSDQLNQYRKWWVLLGTGLTGILVTLDFTIVNIALSTIQRDLSATMSQVQWVVAAFGIPFATFLTIAGRMGDLFGNRKLLYISMLFFLIASLSAGLSTSILPLIIARFFQGLFGAAIFPAGMALTSASFPEKEQGKALGIYGALLGLGFILGPPIGGFILAFINWNWIFFMNIPILIIGFFISLPFVKEVKNAQSERLDLWGMLTFILGFGALIYAITEGPEQSWTSTSILASLILGALLLFLFIIIEKNAEAPIIPIKFMKNRGFLLGVLAYLACISCAWPIVFLMPLYLQNALEYNALHAGLILLPMMIMAVIAPYITGHLFDKKGPLIPFILAFSTLIPSYLMQLEFHLTTPLLWIFIAFALFGFGWGAGNGFGMPLCLSQIPKGENAGVVSGAALTLLNAFGVLFLTLSGMIFRDVENRSLYSTLSIRGITITLPEKKQLQSLLSDSSAINRILSYFPEGIREAILNYLKKSFVDGLHAASLFLLLITILLLIGVIVVMQRKQKKPRTNRYGRKRNQKAA